MTFKDGGTANGTFVFDAATQTVTSWDITTSGGNLSTFPAFEYTPATSHAAVNPGTVSQQVFSFASEAAFPDPIASQPENRYLHLTMVSALTDAGGTIALNPNDPYATECFNCNPFRKLAGGAVTAAGSASLITALNPTATSAGAPSFTLTVNGTGFVTGAVVQWNGTALATTFVSPTSLTALVPAGLIAQPGSATITVSIGGIPSSAASFPVQNGVRLTLSTAVIFALRRPGQAPSPIVNPVRGAGVIPRASVTPTPVTPGSNITFQLLVTNSAPIDATQVTLSSSLSAGLAFQSCSTSTGGPCSASGLNVTASVGTISAYQTATVSVNAIVAPGAATGTALSASSQVRSAEANNSDGTSAAPPLIVADQNIASYKLVRVATPPGAGILLSNPSAVDDIYLNGTQLLLSASANQGWTFSAFGNDLAGASASPALLSISRNMTASANFLPAGMQFVPAVPCRVADTRLAKGPFGGASLSAGQSRDFPIPLSACSVPANATAYSLNVTVVPHGQLQYVTLWATGQPQPFVSTLNSFDGRAKANAAIAPAGNNGAVSVYATDATDVVLDINGYFTPVSSGGAGLAFYPVTPCRVADTRAAAGPLGGPSLAGAAARNLPVLSSNCGIPASAAAYSLNMTVVPASGRLDYLTAWAAGQAQPYVSTLNAPTGTVVANAAIVPAGVSGGIGVFATQTTDLIVDINGYFGSRGGPGALSFYPLAPCRIVDTRLPGGAFGGPALVGGAARSFTVPSSGCGVPAAHAYSFNATVLPGPSLAYLALWPAGFMAPLVSTLNAFDGAITSNAAIVPANAQGAISAYVTDGANLVLDVNGYFAP